MRLGLYAWLTSMATAAVLVALLYLLGLVRAPVLVAIVLPTTAFGILLPILRQAGELGTDFGRYIMGAAAIGELGPLLLASIALAQDKHHFQQTLLSLLFLLIAVGSVLLLATLRSERLSELIQRPARRQRASPPVRVAIVMLLGFVWLANVMGMETVVGAYAAGMAVAMLVDGTGAQALEGRLQTIGGGFFVPIFFIASGVELDLTELLTNPASFARLILSASPLHSFAWRRSGFTEGARAQGFFGLRSALRDNVSSCRRHQLSWRTIGSDVVGERVGAYRRGGRDSDAFSDPRPIVSQCERRRPTIGSVGGSS